VKPRRVIDSDVTPNGEPIELVFEAGHYVVRVNGSPLMSSSMYGSEQAMAAVAAEKVGQRSCPRVLVGGLGMGFTLRAALDKFGAEAEVTVAELMPAVVRYNRGELGALTDHPLQDPRVTLFEGDVRGALSDGGWDAVLMDVDNGPEAFTVPSNEGLYSSAGVQMTVESLAPGGVLIIWSAFRSRTFERLVEGLGLTIDTRRVRARETGKGPFHTLFVIESAR
jgi:spermidine synthase